MVLAATASGLLNGCRRHYRGDVLAKRCWHTGIDMLPLEAWYCGIVPVTKAVLAMALLCCLGEVLVPCVPG